MTFKNIQQLSSRPVGRLTIGRLCIALGIFIAIVSIFAYTAREVVEGETLGRDTQLLLFINSFSNSTLDRIMIIITTLGDVASVLTMTVALLALLYWKKRRRAFVLLAFSMLGAVALNAILKLAFERQRPHLWNLLIHESTYSFPSGHAMLTASLVSVIIILTWKTTWQWWVVGVGLVYVVAVGMSRMYLGVHYPTDVFAGWCLAVIWVSIVASLLGILRWQRSKTKLSESQPTLHT